MTEQTTEQKIDSAAAAALKLANTTTMERTQALERIAQTIEANHDPILEANARDIEAAETRLEAGEYSQALVDRLKLSPTKLDGIVAMVRSVAGQDDPLNQTITARRLDDGLELYKVSVPIGVVGAIFESRPDALVQIASLALKSGNAIILKGGSEATHSNRALFDLLRKATDDLPEGWAQQIEARADVDVLLERDDAIDLLMPRGSTEFVRYIQEHTRIPVLGHADGVCHVFVDREADLEMAADIAFDAKVQYPAVCNAIETLLVESPVAEEFLPEITARYREAGVEIRGDAAVCEIVDVESASEKDWGTEYGDLIIAVRVVDSLENAVEHITRYGSKHTDAIVTDDADRATQFMRSVDSASVFHNASTRFADGYRFGLGAEVGISTGKTHARGPVGLEGLTTYQYFLEGTGQIVDAYVGDDATTFQHDEFDGEWRPGTLSDAS